MAFLDILRAEATGLSIAKALIVVCGSVTARMLYCRTQPHVWTATPRFVRVLWLAVRVLLRGSPLRLV